MPCVFPQRWLKQALEEEGSSSPIRRPGLMMPTDGPLSPPINGDSDSPLPYNGGCCLPGAHHMTHQMTHYMTHRVTRGGHRVPSGAFWRGSIS